VNSNLEGRIRVFVSGSIILIWKKDLYKDKHDAKGDNDEVFYQTLICEPNKPMDKVREEFAHGLQ
jgi:hypothetical protein